MATDNKYDRQLRLWGANGQAALMGAHVLLLGAGPTGSETLKNLVLPGVGQVTVVDGEDVTAADLANNFFVEPAALGRKRADVVVELLCEMNPDVKGTARCVDPAALVASEPAYFTGGGGAGAPRPFSLVVASANQLAPAPLAALGQLCWAAGVPLMVVRAYGQ